VLVLTKLRATTNRPKALTNFLTLLNSHTLAAERITNLSVFINNALIIVESSIEVKKGIIHKGTNGSTQTRAHRDEDLVHFFNMAASQSF
jgi:hypothetical protein